MKEKIPIYLCAHVILRKGNHILLNLRDQTRFASGYYSVISGGVDPGESIKEAAIREIYEEAGLMVKEEDLHFYTLMHSQEKDGIHMSTFFITDRWEGEVENKEPHKHKEMRFYPIDQLPTPLIPYIAKALEGFDKMGTTSHRYYREYRWDR
ncbi:MAG: NUDIX domain-containing protein [Bacteroidota bacterium]